MKPIPPGFSEAADNAPIPGRPWWFGERGQWCRTDRVEVVSKENDRIFGRTKHAETYIVADAADASAREACASYDAAHPLPHPGYRAGQVWLHQDGTTTTVLRCADGVPYGYGERTRSASRGGAIEVLSVGSCWLIHDPLMPSRAPWGPA